MKRGFKILGVMVGVFMLVGLSGLFFATRGLEEGKAITIKTVDIAALDDGVYVGEHDFRRWSNEVEVTLENGRITDIRLIKGFKHEEARKKIYERVVADQTLAVDMVSRATVSSKAYLKAIERALKSSPVE